MGNYAPHAPKDIGMQWVPIKQADYLPDEVTERGYTFSVGNAVPVVSGSYNLPDDFPPALPGAGRIVNLMALYPAGTEARTGPIQQVIIPVSAVSITGSGTSVIGAATAVEALATPYDGAIVQFTLAPQVDFGMSFDMVPYAAALSGKRILNVSFLYQIASLPTNLAAATFSIRRAVPVTSDATHALGLEGTFSLNTPGPVHEIVCGDINAHWDSSVTNPYTTTEIYPWRSNELALFAATAGLTRLIGMLQIGLQDTSQPVQLGYFAMKVTYCEETRVRYGGDLLTGSNTSQSTLRAGTALMRMRDTNFASGTSLPAGVYTLTSVYRNVFGGAATAAYIQRAIRQLYEIPSIQGLNVSESLTVGSTFTKASTAILPQIALHTAAGVVTGSHVYGKQIGAPVYGAVTAIQDVDADSATGQQYPQVRFYARRFGDTTVPLILRSVATPTTFVQISVADFDALPEIVDGWREVTLRFSPTIPTFTGPAGVAQAWQWDAVGETAGNQWQVLGADGPSVTGTQSYGPATYFAPFGATEELTWTNPQTGTSAADPFTDAVLIFAQDPPTITGFTLTPATQAVTGIGLACGAPPRCIPTGISYTQVGWDMGVVCHTFSVDVVDGWGNADTGQSPTVNSGAAADFDVASGIGTITVSAVNADRIISYDVGSADQEVSVLLKAGTLPVGGFARHGVVARLTDGSNFYQGIAGLNTDGSIVARISKRVGGVLTTLIDGTVTFVNGADIMLRFRVVGSTLSLKLWPAAEPEPGTWSATITDTSLTTGTRAGAFARRDTGNTSPTVYGFDNFTAVPGSLIDSSYELQRFDALDNEWQTIMDTEDLCTIAFNDYEARVGVTSDYRIRACDALDFCGPWTTGSATIPAPGITGSGGGAGVLIFTSNANQAGAYNLAYRMQWETGGAQEDFTFPESRSVVLQDMYNKDFPTAFRPAERGGEQFSRVLLVQGAAISAESLANFRSLRDMAWADLPYVAVRDELGNRWYATVLVPNGNVRRNRTLYMAQVDVIEVTDTAAPVDPS